MPSTPKATTESNRQLMRDLFPRAQFGEALAAHYRAELDALNQDHLQTALHQVRRSRECYGTQPPELSWIMQAYNEIHAQDRRWVFDKECAEARDAHHAECANDRDETLAALKALPRERVAAAVAALRAKGYISHDPLPPRIEEWRTGTRSFVLAQASLPTRSGSEGSATQETQQ